MDSLLVLVSGVAGGAVYGLIGLGLVIIYRATDVVNFAMASLATLGLYVAVSLRDRGVATVLGVLAAITITVVAGLLVRETVIRRSAGAVVLGTRPDDGRLTGGRERGRFDMGRPAEGLPRPGRGNGALVGCGTAGPEPADDRRGRRGDGTGRLSVRTDHPRLGHACRGRERGHRAGRRLGAQRLARIAWALGLGLAALGACLYAPRAGLVPTMLSAPLFRAFAGIFLGGLTSMYGAVIGGLTVGVLDNLAANYVSASLRDTFVFSFTVLVLLVRPQGMFGTRTFQRV